jgi:hypothetical protein
MDIIFFFWLMHYFDGIWTNISKIIFFSDGGHQFSCRWVTTGIELQTWWPEIFLSTSNNYPVDAAPTKKLVYWQGNIYTDRKIIFLCRFISVGVFLSVNRQGNWFFNFSVGFSYFCVGFSPTGKFGFPVVVGHHSLPVPFTSIQGRSFWVTKAACIAR